LTLSLILGGAIILGNSVNLPSFLQVMLPTYFHLFMLGWITQLIFGVAWWLFPLLPENRSKGNEKLAWGLYFLLNSGLLLRVLSEPCNTLYPNTTWAIFLVFSAFIQVISGFIYTKLLWPRIRSKTQRKQES
jgi:hypothetical protein